MTKTLVALATASTLTLSFAFAQNAANPSSSSAPGFTQSGTSGSASGKSDAMEKPADAAGGPNIIAAQTPDQWLASRFKGTHVIGQDDAKVGTVDDILFDRSGSVKAVVVGVGGFLGIGSKEVALSISSFQVVPAKDGRSDQLRLSMTKDQLSAATEFKPYEPPRPTASNAMSGNPTRPSTSGMAR